MSEEVRRTAPNWGEGKDNDLVAKKGWRVWGGRSSVKKVGLDVREIVKA